MKTLSEVLRDSGLSYQTIVKFIQMGLISKPQRVWGGRGKGSESLFSDDVIKSISRVKHLQKRRFTLSEIAEQFKKERGDIEVLKPTEDYLIPIKAEEVKSYITAYTEFHSWLQKQIGQQMPGYKFHSVEMENVVKQGVEYLVPKEIKVKPLVNNE
ncbi:MerR family transcriptional regulator [Chloroflexota bacterium]